MPSLIPTLNPIQTPETQLSDNSYTSQNTYSTNANTIPISGKKVVTLGGNSEQIVGTVDLQYKTIYNDLFRFRKLSKTDTSSSSGGDIADQMFYALDQPGHYYFKIFFYFSNPYSDPSNPLSSNLLGITYLDDEASKQTGKEEVNTALNYLHNNMEYTRFNRLAEFIQLLSDISTKSPWYFQSISGLDQAIERPEVGNQSFKIEEERKTITIKCLPDAYDNRIGRLLDLYRSVVYSQNLHKWILPANLRKFDMGIYIFNSPIKTIAGGRYGVSGKISERVLETTFKDYYGDASEDSGEFAEQMYNEPRDISVAGSKYIELRGCEIDYNSSKSAYSELDNAEGKSMEYEIIIRYDSAAEDRYDPIFRSYVGDFVVEDLLNRVYEKENTGNPYAGISSSNSSYVDGSVGDPFGANNQRTLLDSAIGMGIGYVNTLVGKVMFGNIYGFSFGKLDSIVSADPMSALISAGREVNNAKLIAKRISDFTDPGKGTRELSGKNFRDPDDYHQDEEWDLSGKSLRSPETDHTDEEWNLTDKSLRSQDTDHQDEEWNLTDKSLRSPDTDHQDEDANLSEKNMYRGWEVTPANNDLSGKSFSRPDTDHQSNDWDLNGRTFHRETDHIDEEWDLSDRNFYRP